MILWSSFLLIEGVEAGGQNTGQPGATQEVGGEEQSPHQHRVEGKHRVNVEKDGLHPGLKYGESEILYHHLYHHLLNCFLQM